MRLHHHPFDRGIDQSFQSFGGTQTTALKTCKNLVHQRAGILSPRPGLSEENLGATGNVQALAHAGGRNVCLVDSRAYYRAETGWGPGQVLGTMLPYAQWELPIGDVTANHMTHAAFGRHLIVCYTLGLSVYFEVYEARTRIRVSRTTVTASLGALAWRGDTFSPVAVYIDGSNNLQVAGFNASTGEFDAFASRGAATAGCVGLRACGHENGSFHVAYWNATDVRVARMPDASTNRTELLTSLVLPITQALCHLVEISATDVVLAWVDSAFDLYAVNVSTASAGTVRNVAGTFNYLAAARYETTPTTTLAYLYTTGGSFGDVTLHQLTTTALTTLGSTDNQAVAGAVPFVDGDRYPIRILNADAAGDDRRTSIGVQNQDLALDGGYESGEDQESFLFDDGLPKRAARVFRSTGNERWNVLEYSYAAHDPDRCVVSANDLAVVLGAPPCLLSASSESSTADPLDQATYISPPTRPVISVAATTAGSGLTASTTYQVLAVFEFRDDNGVIWQSWPSEAQSVTLGGGDDSIAVTVDDYGGGPAINWDVRIYMTDAVNQTIFYDALGEGVLVEAGVWTSAVTDSALRTRAIFYQEGGVLANDPAPPCRFGAFGLLRLFVGGCLRRERLQFSKETLAGEALGFPDDAAFWIDFPSELTGIAAIDDAIVVFERTRISIVSGAGPDARGIGNFQVREVSRNLGADDWRAVCATSEGVFFTSGGTIWLLPRGFGAPISIGAKVADLLEAQSQITSVAELSYSWGKLVQFARRDASRLVLSTGGVAPGNWYEWASPFFVEKVAQFIVDGETEGAVVRAELASAQGPCTEALTRSFDAIPSLGGSGQFGFDLVLETHDWSAVGVTGDMRVQRTWMRVLVSGAVTDWAVTADTNGGREIQTLTGSLTAPSVQTWWQNIEHTLPRPRIQSLTVRVVGTTSDEVDDAMQFAGLTFEYDVEGAAKEAIARRQ